MDDYEVPEEPEEPEEADSDSEEESEDAEAPEGAAARDPGVVPCVAVAPDARITSDRLTRYELAQLLALRATQIARSGTAYAEGEDTAVALARRELLEKRCPLLLRRAMAPRADGAQVYEYWDVNEMALPTHSWPKPMGGRR